MKILIANTGSTSFKYRLLETEGEAVLARARPRSHSMWFLTAYRTRAALESSPSARIVLYLWKATVRALIPRSAATSFIGLPRASRRRPRWPAG